MFGASDSHCYIRVIIISKIIISGSCPIHFTVTLPGYRIFIAISGILLYRRWLYWCSIVLPKFSGEAPLDLVPLVLILSTLRPTNSSKVGYLPLPAQFQTV